MESAPENSATSVRIAGKAPGAHPDLRIGMVVGPTGSGKTAFAIALAERLGAEIVNADARQLYRGMDLGTAKPGEADRARITHHLIDVQGLDDPIDVAGFVAMADRAIAEIAARGRPVIVAGGSGLYLRALRGGLCAAPPGAPGYRTELAALAARHGVPYLHRRLHQVDPEAAVRIGPNDLPRIARALEVHAASGVPISEHQRRHRFRGGYRNLAIGLSVARERLYARIDRRFDAMIAAGLVAEVRGLIAAGLRPGSLLTRTIGYRELVRYLCGQCGLDEAIETAKRESRRLAKRQMTWFRREPEIIWLDPEDGLAEACRLLEEFFNAPPASGRAAVNP